MNDLRCFEIVSSLKINQAKSLLVGMGSLEDEMQLLADLLLCKVGKLSLLYLGLPIMTKTSSKEI